MRGERSHASPATAPGQPAAQGLYDPRHEHDACGVGFVVNITGKKSHTIVRQALQVLINLQRLADERVRLLARDVDRKSTRLNSSHRCISYAVFCLKKKKKY